MTFKLPTVALCTLLVVSTCCGRCRAAASTESEPSEVALPPVVTAIAVNPQGTRIATGGDDHLVRIWDYRDGALLQVLRGHQDWVTSVAFSTDGSHLYSAAEDGRVLDWNPEDGALRQELLRQQTPYTSLSTLARSEELLAVGFRCPLQIVGRPGSRLPAYLDCPCVDTRVVVASPDGRQFAAGGRNGRIRIWAREDGRMLHDIQAHDQRLRTLVYSPDGTRLVSAGDDRAICIWDPVSGKEIRHISRSKGKIFCLAALDEKRLAAGTSENVIDLWDMTTGERTGSLEGHTGSVSSLARQGNRLISGGFDATIRWWDVTPGAAAVAMHVIDLPLTPPTRR